MTTVIIMINAPKNNAANEPDFQRIEKIKKALARKRKPRAS